MLYRYGMRLRGFSPGAQPEDGLVGRRDCHKVRFHDIIVYNRPLTAAETDDYGLTYLGIENGGYDIIGLDEASNYHAFVGTFYNIGEATQMLDKLKTAFSDEFTFIIISQKGEI